MKRGTKALVNYESSDEETSPKDSPPHKKRKLPALSSNLVVPVPVDDPSRHQGRIRLTPHVEGNWAAHVYLSIRIHHSHAFHSLVNKIIIEAQRYVPTLHRIVENSDDAQRSFELHVSLSRPFFIRTHQKEALRKVIKELSKHPPFVISFTSLSELHNDEHTRTFLTMEIGAGHHELKKLCGDLEPFLSSLRQQTYYSSPRFHASIAWALLDEARVSQNLTPETEHSSTKSPPIVKDIAASVTPQDTMPFPTIPRFPPELIVYLNRNYSSQLCSPKMGSFDVNKINVKIGKEITSWSFRCV